MKCKKGLHPVTAMLTLLVMLLSLMPLQMIAKAELQQEAPSNVLELNVVKSNGSLDCVEFTAESGDALTDAHIRREDTEIYVTLPKTYNPVGKVTATFTLTQNADGIPFVSPKNGATGNSANKAWNQKTNTYTTTLAGGAGTAVVYFYDVKPKATNNVYDTYKIHYKMENTAPTRTEGVAARVTGQTVVGTPFAVNLDEIFSDADGDALHYQVSVNGAPAIAATAQYSFAPPLGGAYTLVFSASDGKDSAADTYTVALQVENASVTYPVEVLIPEGIAPEFYITNGYDAEGYDCVGEALSVQAGAAADGFVPYTVAVPKNITTISVRAEGLGGMSVPVADAASITFREVHVLIATKTDGNFVTAQQASIAVQDKDGHYATAGASGTDSDGILYYAYLLAATGNDRQYTFYAKPLGTLASIYAITQADNKIVPALDAAVYENTLNLSYKNAFKLNVPQQATAQAFQQKNNYNTAELTALEIQEEADGSKTYYYNIAAGSDAYSYRVTQPGKITKAGYIRGSELKINRLADDATPTQRVEYDKTTVLGARGDDSLLLNVNAQGSLVLEMDSTYRLRAYRIWQIINNDTMNKMIEPDFSYKVLSGEEIIRIVPVTTGNGNAKNNWLDITAIGEGTAILEVGYDALEIVSGNQGSFNAIEQFTFGAIAPQRTGLVVIQTANAATEVDFGIQCRSRAGENAVAWDAEFDTLYFTGQAATVSFAPSVAQGSIAAVECSNDKGATWTELAPQAGVYRATVLAGNNLLRVTKADGTTAYQVVRGEKINIDITNVTNPGTALTAGDTARITLDGVHFPLGKMSGIYNPGYGNGHRLAYTFAGEEVLTAEAYQYDFPTHAYIEVTLPADAQAGDAYTLTNGYIYFNNMGSAPGTHRNITDAGVSSNMGASNTMYSRCMLPDVTLTIANVPSAGEEDTDTDNDATGGDVPPAPPMPPTEDRIDVSDLQFDIEDSEIRGYVTVSFTDNGVRRSGESGVVCKEPLGEIIETVEVPFANRDTVATVTLRLLKALEIQVQHSGSATGGFYLSSIGDFTHNGVYYRSFGEFDAGAGSGWMVKHNNWFVNMGASEFAVADGDRIEWLYTCRLGADIGCDWSNPSAEITGLRFVATYGTLSPAFDQAKTQYTYTVPTSVESIRLLAEPENYWAKLTYSVGEKSYKPMEAIPVSDGTQIRIDSRFARAAGEAASDTDTLTITIKVKGTSGGSAPAQKEEQQTEAEEDEPLTESQISQDTPPKKAFDATTFSDVCETDWYYTAVKYVLENGLMQGTDTGFAPEEQMTRAMLVTVLYRIEQPQAPLSAHGFADVAEDMWYSDAVAWAAANGLVTGVSRTGFAPEENITREQMACILYRYAAMKGYAMDSLASLDGFADAGHISAWAKEALQWAHAAGLIAGTSETALSPERTATRAQVATILMRFCEMNETETDLAYAYANRNAAEGSL